uniref:Lysozyme n=1 Tax=Leguminivora glycinivorella TaxID=1035111 RepID=A0A346RAF1_9NEOP|nr:c-type lysozyme 5 [Leguminivora glycinivorella]
MCKIKEMTILSLIFLALVAHDSLLAEAKIMAKCDAVKELQKAGVQKTFFSNWICLMKMESGMNTSLLTGPKTASSYSHGIFQINSRKWCSRGHTGGKCNKRCEDFLNDDIQDDIVCAVKIFETEGWKSWDGWVKKCKQCPANLPDVNCKSRRSSSLESLFESDEEQI